MIAFPMVPLFQSLAYMEVGTHAIPGRLIKAKEGKSYSGHDLKVKKID
jgi:hypothetical protein